MSDIGGLLPMALWGRTSLYSRRHSYPANSGSRAAIRRECQRKGRYWPRPRNGRQSRRAHQQCAGRSQRDVSPL